MIKICGCAFRKPGLDPSAWLDHYHERHGPLIASLRGFTADLTAYRQNYVDPGLAHLPADVPEAPGGISELWYPSLDAAQRAFSDPEYLDIGRADEQAFVDLAAGIGLFGKEHLISSRGVPEGANRTDEPGHRLFVFRKRAEDLSRTEFQRLWLSHGIEMSRQAWFDPVVRYVQTQTLPNADRIRRPARHDLVDEFQCGTASDARALLQSSPILVGGTRSQLIDPAHTLAVVARSHLVMGG